MLYYYQRAGKLNVFSLWWGGGGVGFWKIKFVFVIKVVINKGIFFKKNQREWFPRF